MRRAALLVLCFSCGPGRIPPVTHVDGTVRGVGFENPSAIWREKDDHDPRLLVLTDVPSACSHVSTRGYGELPVIWFDGGHAPELVFQGDSAAAIDLGADGGVVTASSATVELWGQTKTTLTGNFTATFGGETISGEFVADECKALEGSCSCSVVGFAAPLLALLLLQKAKRPRPLERGRVRALKPDEAHHR